MNECPYCSQIHKVGGMFCNRVHSYDSVAKLDSGIHVIKSNYIETPDPHFTRLSVNLDFDGDLPIEVKGRKYVVSPNRFLLLNQGAFVSSRLRSERPHTTVCIAFKTGLVESIHYVLASSHEKLLDQPYGTSSPVHFFERTYDMDLMLYSKAKKVVNSVLVNTMDKQSLDLFYEELLEYLVVTQHKTQAEIHSIQRARFSTKVEIYSRLNWVREFIHDNYASISSLQEMASIACLSLHHFKRLFKEIYQCTPHQYLTSVRLNNAKNLLRTSDLDVNEVCQRVGFENPSSFIRLFKTTQGQTPKKFRSGQVLIEN